MTEVNLRTRVALIFIPAMWAEISHVITTWESIDRYLFWCPLDWDVRGLTLKRAFEGGGYLTWNFLPQAFAALTLLPGFLCHKGELQRKNKLTSYERAFKMLETVSVSLESIKPSSSYEAVKSSQGITKRESPYSRNFRKSSIIWGSFHWKWRHIWQVKFPNIKNWDIL